MASSNLLAAELEKLDPAIPFRASTTHRHHTWARTFHSYPELYIRPQSLAEVQKVVTLARRCRRRVVVVGCGHSPSDITCTSAWMVNLDRYNRVLHVDRERRTMLVEGGIRLHELNARAWEHGLTMQNLGSIDEQSIAGAIATATHGSTLRHGLISESVRSLRIVLANGSAVRCSAEQNQELFRAALVSLGALGIIVEVEFEMVENARIEWDQTLRPLSYVLENWEKDLWTKKEFIRVWWLPYMKRAIVWQADKTDKPERQPATNWYGGSVGFHTYHILLWMAHYVPRILPAIEWFVFGMQYGFKDGAGSSAVEEQRTGLLMNCLYSQFVNEWALPLHKGPEAITRISAWINHKDEESGIPFSSKGLWVHAPVEVRVSDTSNTNVQPRPYLDSSVGDGPTLYLNFTLYRPYNKDPPCHHRYYQAVEWLMKEMGAKPHWAKNFHTVTHNDLKQMYGEDLASYLKVRNDVDPEGMFVGEWHRRTILPPLSERAPMALEERELTRKDARHGGVVWVGEPAKQELGRPKSSSSDESFDILHEAEAEASVVLPRTHGSAKDGFTGVQVFDKM